MNVLFSNYNTGIKPEIITGSLGWMRLLAITRPSHFVNENFHSFVFNNKYWICESGLFLIHENFIQVSSFVFSSLLSFFFLFGHM